MYTHGSQGEQTLDKCNKKWNKVPPIILNLHDKKIKDLKVKVYHLCSGVRGWTENHWRKMDDIYKNVSKIKSNMKNRKNITTFLEYKKNKLKNSYKIKIDYLELRNRKNLKLSNTINNSKLFIAYYLKKVRLIDNI